jgi:hypothetical protein
MVGGTGTGADLGVVFGECDITDPVQAVLDAGSRRGRRSDARRRPRRGGGLTGSAADGSQPVLDLEGLVQQLGAVPHGWVKLDDHLVSARLGGAG